MALKRSLAGQWDFQLDPEGRLGVADLAPDRKISVPLPWQAAFPELRRYGGFAWYRTTVRLDEAWLQGSLLLTFGAVDYWCQLFINRQPVGEHEGGYTPFTCDIAPYARPGENELALRVYDPVQDAITFQRWYEPSREPSRLPFDAQNVPHGKQEWYINVGGIWQDVTLVAKPATYIDQVHVTPNIHTGRIDLSIELGGKTASLDGAMLRVQVGDRTAATALKSGQSGYTAALTINNPELWTPDAPNLYTATVQLQGLAADDECTVRFGFREITTRNGQLLLNGQPLFLLSALDQDLYPNTIYTVPSDAFLRDQFQKAKRLGLNNLRCHIKPPDPRYLDLADEIGLLVWAEIPSWRTFYVRTTVHPDVLRLDEAIKARVQSTLAEMIRRDYNHPSLIIWTLVNEDWGTSLPLSSADRAWVRRLFDLCKRLDPTRLVVDNSACGAAWGPNIHVKSDIDDFHLYTNIPDQAESWVQYLEQFNLQPLWTYSSHGDAQRTGQEPLILSEFGNWGMPSLRSLRAPTGQDPAWFDLGAWWSPWDGEPGWPQGVEERFTRFGLEALWPDYEAFAAATQWHQFRAMKFEIETMRRLAHLAGYVITEFTDAYWESNGLLDFDRNPKVYNDRLAEINAPDVIIPQFNRYANWDDQPLYVRLYGSHYSAADWSGGRLRWTLGDHVDEIQIGSVERGTVFEFGLKRLDLPAVDRPTSSELTFTLTDSAGRELVRNSTDVLVLPASARLAAFSGEVAVSMRRDQRMIVEADQLVAAAPHMTDHSASSGPVTGHSTPVDQATTTRTAPTRGFRRVIEQLGYRTTRELSPATRLIITDYPTAAMLDWVRDGGDMLLLSSGPGPFFWRQGRAGTYSGNWISSFAWIRPEIHTRLAISNPLDLPFADVMPTGVILGLPIEDKTYQRDFLAGQISGWLRHPAIYTVQFRYGRGRVLMTTFTLKEALQEEIPDPVGVAMLHDLVDYLTSDACQPALMANYER
jgi:hypothetical protein